MAPHRERSRPLVAAHDKQRLEDTVAHDHAVVVGAQMRLVGLNHASVDPYGLRAHLYETIGGSVTGRSPTSPTRSRTLKCLASGGDTLT